MVKEMDISEADKQKRIARLVKMWADEDDGADTIGPLFLPIIGTILLIVSIPKLSDPSRIMMFLLGCGFQFIYWFFFFLFIAAFYFR